MGGHFVTSPSIDTTRLLQQRFAWPRTLVSLFLIGIHPGRTRPHLSHMGTKREAVGEKKQLHTFTGRPVLPAQLTRCAP